MAPEGCRNQRYAASQSLDHLESGTTTGMQRCDGHRRPGVVRRHIGHPPRGTNPRFVTVAKADAAVLADDDELGVGHPTAPNPRHDFAHEPLNCQAIRLVGERSDEQQLRGLGRALRAFRLGLGRGIPVWNDCRIVEAQMFEVLIAAHDDSIDLGGDSTLKPSPAGRVYEIEDVARKRTNESVHVAPVADLGVQELIGNVVEVDDTRARPLIAALTVLTLARLYQIRSHVPAPTVAAISAFSFDGRTYSTPLGCNDTVPRTLRTRVGFLARTTLPMYRSSTGNVAPSSLLSTRHTWSAPRRLSPSITFATLMP